MQKRMRVKYGKGKKRYWKRAYFMQYKNIPIKIGSILLKLKWIIIIIVVIFGSWNTLIRLFSLVFNQQQFLFNFKSICMYIIPTLLDLVHSLT